MCCNYFAHTVHEHFPGLCRISVVLALLWWIYPAITYWCDAELG